MGEPFMKSHEAAAKIGVCIHTLYRWIKRGDIKFMRVVGEYRFKPEIVRQFIYDRVRHPRTNVRKTQHAAKRAALIEEYRLKRDAAKV